LPKLSNRFFRNSENENLRIFEKTKFSEFFCHERGIWSRSATSKVTTGSVQVDHPELNQVRCKEEHPITVKISIALQASSM